MLGDYYKLTGKGSLNSVVVIENCQIEKCQIEKFQIEKFQIEKCQIEKCQMKSVKYLLHSL